MHLDSLKNTQSLRALSLLEKLGADAVDLIIEQFYQRVLKDELLSPFFKELALEQLIEHQRAFFYMALGGPDLYKGRSMAEAHKGLNLQETHFNILTNHLVKALQDYAIEDELIVEVIKTIGSLKPDVLYK